MDNVPAAVAEAWCRAYHDRCPQVDGTPFKLEDPRWVLVGVASTAAPQRRIKANLPNTSTSEFL